MDDPQLDPSSRETIGAVVVRWAEPLWFGARLNSCECPVQFFHTLGDRRGRRSQLYRVLRCAALERMAKLDRMLGDRVKTLAVLLPIDSIASRPVVRHWNHVDRIRVQKRPRAIMGGQAFLPCRGRDHL